MHVLWSANLALRFLLEVGALAAFCYWGATASTATFTRVALAVAIPALVALIWGTFISPKARISTGRPGQVFLGLAVFLLAAAALWHRGRSTVAIVHAVLAVVSSVLLLVSPQQSHGETGPTSSSVTK